MLFGLINFNPHEKAMLEQWSLWHKADHDEIQQAIQRITGQNLMIWEIYPLRMEEWEGWSERHQQMHNDMNAVAGIAGSDLSDVDWKVPTSAEEWNFKHFKEHRDIRSFYGI